MPDRVSDIEKRLDTFVARLIQSGIARESDLMGCSDAEVGTLERTYGVRVPASYRGYLKRVGHGAGRLFTHDHVKACYDDVLTLTAQERERQRKRPAANRLDLPTDALLILDRLGEQHLFIRCGRRQDPPVLYYNDWDGKMVESHPSVLDWLETWRAEAEAAIRDGYYDLKARDRKRSSR